MATEMETQKTTAPELAPIATEQKKTHGEKRFDQLNWIVGYVVTFVATIIPAYYFRDSSKTSWFDKDKSWREWTKDKKGELANTWFKSFEKNKTFNHEAVADIFVSTTATFAGGFIVLPVIKWMENNKQKIVHYFNEKKGDDSEIAAGDENTENHKSPSWGALLKGRLGSFAIVFTSFMVLHGFFPKPMDSITKFGEDTAVSIGRKITGKDLGDPNTPKTWAYRLNRGGNLTIFDSVATAASITLTLAISKLKGTKEDKSTPSAPPITIATNTRDDAPIPDAAPPSDKKHTAEIQPKEKPQSRADYRDEHEKEKAMAANGAAMAPA
jgi:hypothetical protein